MLFRDPKNILNSHASGDFLCVTASREKARAFYKCGKPGVIALRNRHTRAVGLLLDSFNARSNPKNVTEDMLGEAMRNLLKQIIAKGVKSPMQITKPHERFGWDNAPHVDNADVALLAGSERPVEIHCGPPVRDADITKPDLVLEAEWLSLYKPVSFLPHTLIVMIAGTDQNWRTTAPMHRIPRKLYPSEQRGHILKAVL